MEHSQHTQKLATTTTLSAANPPANGRKNNFTRKTHPRCARAHRRSLRRALREAMRRALSKKSVLAGLAAVVAQGSHAETGATPSSYAPVFKDAGGSAYVLLKSDNVADNYLAIHFDATQRCRATLTVLDYYLQTFDEEEKASWQELNGRQFPTAMQAQIGDAPRGEINAQIHFEFDESDSPQGLLSVSFKGSTRFIQDLQEQPQADLRYRRANGEWTERLSYSLTSAQAGIGSAVGHCKEWAREVRGPEVIVL
jgi:hypothetical protein